MTPVNPRFVAGRDVCNQILTRRFDPAVSARVEPVEQIAVAPRVVWEHRSDRPAWHPDDCNGPCCWRRTPEVTP